PERSSGGFEALKNFCKKTPKNIKEPNRAGGILAPEKAKSIANSKKNFRRKIILARKIRGP
ncbi:MAG TPA: hypothetical protein PLY30_00875, partial [Candidatus Omnitrophota bacterium]|nr:hypothetical protein [Candidatus Omnitrophota bacterium]